jgi:tetratricopeptide (TPR) repeat protein
LVDRLRPALVAIRDSIARLIPADPAPTSTPHSKEKAMSTSNSATGPAADGVFDEGMEHWWAGDRPGAARLFRRALKLDPQHADAHNHLGIVSLEARKLKAADKHFRAAIDGGQRQLERDGAEVHWGFIENRPYLRGLANLALVLVEQKKWAEALAIHRQMLELNPNDNQGVRWLVGVECLRVGDDKGAVAAFSKVMAEEVGCAFGLALAKLRVGAPPQRSARHSSPASPRTATWPRCCSASAGSASMRSTVRTWPSPSGQTMSSRHRRTSGRRFHEPQMCFGSGGLLRQS